MSKYIPPKLQGHKVIYKGRRFWIFEVSEEHGFEDCEEFCTLVIYDKFIEAPVGFGDKETLVCKIPVGPYEVDARGSSPRELARQAAATLLSNEKY